MTGAEFRTKLANKVKHHCNRWGRRFGSTAREYFLINGRTVQIAHRQTRADVGVITQCLWEKQYEIPLVKGDRHKTIDRLYCHLLSQGKKPLIVDGGANIGASTLWFAARYPDAHIVAIEPAPDNFRFLALNTQSYNVDALQAGLGVTAGTAILTDPGEGEWGYRTESSGNGIEVPMTTLSEILSTKGKRGYHPFILKLDIEGSERDLFDGTENSVRRFPVVILELHDWMLPTQRSALGFFHFHISEMRDFTQRGENVFSIDYASIESILSDC